MSEVPSPVPSTATLADWVREHAPDCGDNSCLFGGRGKGGMRTNGGCRCYRDVRPDMKRIFIERLFAAFSAAPSTAPATGEPDWIPALTFLHRHRRHVELSPGAGKDAQSYALAVLDDLENDLRSLLPKVADAAPRTPSAAPASGATPRTDAVLNTVNPSLADDMRALLEHARQLERELAEAQRTIEQLAEKVRLYSSAPSHEATTGLPVEHGKRLGDRIDQLERELARDSVLEEAAKVCDAKFAEADALCTRVATYCAIGIRALKTQPPETEPTGEKR